MAFRTDFAPYLVRLSMSDFLKLYFYDTGLAANLLGIGRATGHCTQSRSNRPPRTGRALSENLEDLAPSLRTDHRFVVYGGSESFHTARQSADFDSLEASTLIGLILFIRWQMAGVDGEYSSKRFVP